jgi:hypothetical protein
MRRPGPINIDDYVAALDLQLREEVARIERRTLPDGFHRVARAVKTVLQPILQSGAMVLTSIAVIVAVGAAPASMQTPAPVDTPLATPTEPRFAVTEEVQLRDSLPPDEFLVVADEFTSVPLADNPDMPPMEKE